MKKEPFDLNKYRLWKKYRSAQIRAKREGFNAERRDRVAREGQKLYGDVKTTGRQEPASTRRKRKRREGRARASVDSN